jgi:hypothetical protein
MIKSALGPKNGFRLLLLLQRSQSIATIVRTFFECCKIAKMNCRVISVIIATKSLIRIKFVTSPKRLEINFEGLLKTSILKVGDKI